MQFKLSKFIEGEKLYLREVTVEDIENGYYDWINDIDVIKYTESRFYPNSKKQLEEYILKISDDMNSVFFAIIDKKTNKYIGNIKLGNINWIHRFGDIGIIIGDKDFWGKGYAQEAIKLIVNYGFKVLNLNKLTAGCYSLNKGSIGAFKKVGFEEEGYLKKHYFYNGEYIDAVVLAIEANSL